MNTWNVLESLSRFAIVEDKKGEAILIDYSQLAYLGIKLNDIGINMTHTDFINESQTSNDDFLNELVRFNKKNVDNWHKKYAL